MRVIPWKDELLGVTDGCYSINILILGADDSFLDDNNNSQIIEDAPWQLIVECDYPNTIRLKLVPSSTFMCKLVLNGYKVKL